MLEFLIQASDAGELWPSLPAARAPDVLLPRGWGAEPVEGRGDLRFAVDGVEVSIAGESAGWQVSFEGELDPVSARAVVETIAEQVAAETGRPVRVVEI